MSWLNDPNSVLPSPDGWPKAPPKRSGPREPMGGSCLICGAGLPHTKSKTCEECLETIGEIMRKAERMFA